MKQLDTIFFTFSHHCFPIILALTVETMVTNDQIIFGMIILKIANSAQCSLSPDALDLLNLHCQEQLFKSLRKYQQDGRYSFISFLEKPIVKTQQLAQQRRKQEPRNVSVLGSVHAKKNLLSSEILTERREFVPFVAELSEWN